MRTSGGDGEGLFSRCFDGDGSGVGCFLSVDVLLGGASFSFATNSSVFMVTTTGSLVIRVHGMWMRSSWITPDLNAIGMFVRFSITFSRRSSLRLDRVKTN